MIQRLFQPFNTSHASCSLLSTPSQPITFFHCLWLLTSFLSFALILPLQTPLSPTPQPHPPCSTVAYNYFPSLPFCPGPLALSFHYCLVAPLPGIAFAPTQPQLSLQSGSKTQADLELCKDESF